MWEFVGVCGSMWEYVGVCGSLWEYMGVCGSMWEFVGVCGSMLGRIQLPVTEGVGGSVGVFADHDGRGDRSVQQRLFS